MLNQVVLVGRLTSDPELFQTETGKKMTYMTLAVPRSYKNSQGQYETDFISCKLWQAVAQNTVDYCKKGDLVGIRGKIETYSYESEEGRKYFTEVIADKVTFLSNKKAEV